MKVDVACFIIWTFCVVISPQGSVADCTYKQPKVVKGVLVTEVDVQNGHYCKLECHVTSFNQSDDVLLWYFQVNASSPWQVYPFSWGITYYSRYMDVELGNSNQTLRIKTALKSAEGHYKCVSQSSAVNRTWTRYTMRVFDCVEGRIKPVTKGPNPSLLADVGDKVSFSCTADYGCKYSSMNSIEWQSLKGGKHYSKLNNGHYTVKLQNRNIGRNLNSTLTFSVKKEDFDMHFQCLVKYTTPNNGTVQSIMFPFKLRQKVVVTDSGPLIKKIVPGLLSPLVLGVLFTLLLKWRYGYCVRLYYKEHLKFSTASVIEKEFDMVILNEDNEEDKELAMEMKTSIENHDLRVATLTEDIITPGHDERDEVKQLLCNTASVVFLMPLNDSQSQELENLYNFVESDKSVPLLRSVAILGIDKAKLGYNKRGILCKALLHLPQPSKEEVNKFCKDLIKKMHLETKKEGNQGGLCEDDQTGLIQIR